MDHAVSIVEYDIIFPCHCIEDCDGYNKVIFKP